MRNYLMVMVATIGLGMSLASAFPARDADWQAQQKQLKVQQKLERKALKDQQRNVKQSWKNSRVDSATRAYTKHQMQRASRDLKLKQKDARQDMKDRHKQLQAMERVYGK